MDVKEFKEQNDSVRRSLLEKSKRQIIIGKTVDFEKVLSAVKKTYNI